MEEGNHMQRKTILPMQWRVTKLGDFWDIKDWALKNVMSMFRIIEKANNAQKAFGKRKQFCHKEIPSTAMLTVVSFSRYVFSEKKQTLEWEKGLRAALIKDMELSLFNNR